MAANDYFNNTSYSSAGHQQPGKTDSPISRIDTHPSSPFDDPYRLNTTQSSGAVSGYDTSYHPASQYNSTSHLNDRYDSPSGGGRHPDPFADQNAIQMQNQAKMDGGSPTRYNADPEFYGDGVEPARNKRAKKKEGWFSGRITWVVYILTIVQIGVFVGELIKMGMFAAYKQCIQDNADFAGRYAHRLAYSNEAKLQYHDWSFAVRHHQHGRSIHALHAQYPDYHPEQSDGLAVPEHDDTRCVNLHVHFK